jgi:hypothetical protein
MEPKSELPVFAYTCTAKVFPLVLGAIAIPVVAPISMSPLAGGRLQAKFTVEVTVPNGRAVAVTFTK